MYWISKSIHLFSRFRRQLLTFLSVLGPGIVVMMADNDAGGISTYAVTGSQYGFNLLWVILILVPMAYYVQEMTVRVGAVTKRGHAEAVFDSFGPFWGWFSVVDLALINWLTLITEYIGMMAAMAIFGIPPWVTFIGVTLVLMGIVMSGRYWTFEKLALLFCVFNLVYIPAALWAMKTPSTTADWGSVLRGFYHPAFKDGFTPSLIFMIMAVVGTTITPWQVYFQQSAVVDKGLDIRDIRLGKMDTLAGSILTGVFAVFIIITTGAAFYYTATPRVIESAAETAEALVPILKQGEWAKRLFAIGLFDAGFLGALCISLATSWSLGEVFGWAHSLNKSVRDAPWFYVAYLTLLLTAGAVVLIPGAPLLTITMFVQVVAVTLLPAALIFMLLQLNDETVMGEYVNTPWQNITNWGITIFVIVMATGFAVSELFPSLMGKQP